MGQSRAAKHGAYATRYGPSRLEPGVSENELSRRVEAEA